MYDTRHVTMKMAKLHVVHARCDVVDYCTSSNGRIVTLDLKVELYNMFNVK